jgi:predicted acylesterase/phospholipase RssA
LDRGEQVVLSMGDIARAVRITCTLPGIFVPVQWGGRTLIDGGLLNVVPVDVARGARMDIVVGLHLQGTKFLFTPGQILLKKIFNLLKKFLLINEASRIWHAGLAILERSDLFNYFREAREFGDQEHQKDLFTVLGRSLDLAIEKERQQAQSPIQASDIAADLMIRPTIPRLRLEGLEYKEQYYLAGRQSALEYLPQIQELINQKQKEKVLA